MLDFPFNMPHIPRSVTKKLLLLSEGEAVPASSINASWLKLLEAEEIVKKIRQGRTRAQVMLTSVEHLDDFLYNRFGIRDLEAYAAAMATADLSGKGAHDIAGDTKLRTRRTFQGFLINSLNPVEATLNGVDIVIAPTPGIFSFIYDFETFRLPANVTVVGIENPENFRHLDKQAHLFSGQNLFVSRYPHSPDLHKWLQSIPNSYLHFGDFDLAGIAIFENEFKSKLGSKADFFVPPGIEKLLRTRGSRELYNRQFDKFRNLRSDRPEIQELIQLIHTHKRGLEQEAFIKD